MSEALVFPEFPELPELPESRKKRYKADYKLSDKAANFVIDSKYYSEMFEEAIAECNNPIAVGNWLMSDVARIVNEREEEPNQIPFTGKDLGKLITLIDKNVISTAIAKKVLEKMFENPEDPEKITKDNGWIQISDQGEIEKIVKEILEANPQSIADYKAGKDRALGFLVGQAMKATKGKANPKMLNELFIEELKK